MLRKLRNSKLRADPVLDFFDLLRNTANYGWFSIYLLGSASMKWLSRSISRNTNAKMFSVSSLRIAPNSFDDAELQLEEYLDRMLARFNTPKEHEGAEGAREDGGPTPIHSNPTPPQHTRRVSVLGVDRNTS